MMRAEGLEPPRLAPLAPKASVSTNSTTPARRRPGPASGRTPVLPGASMRDCMVRRGHVHLGTLTRTPKSRSTTPMRDDPGVQATRAAVGAPAPGVGRAACS